MPPPVILIRGGDRSLSFRRRLLCALAHGKPLPTSSEDRTAQSSILTKYYRADVTYTVEETEDVDAIIAIADGTDVDRLLEHPTTSEDAAGRDMVKLLVTFDDPEHAMIDDGGEPFPASTREHQEKCWDAEFEYCVWQGDGVGRQDPTETKEEAEGIWRIREALRNNMWRDSVMLGKNVQAKRMEDGTDTGEAVSEQKRNSLVDECPRARILIAGGSRSLSFRRTLAHVLSLPADKKSSFAGWKIKTTNNGMNEAYDDEGPPDGSNNTPPIIKGTILTKYYSAPVQYCLQADESSREEAIIAVADGSPETTEALFLENETVARKRVQIYLTFSSSSEKMVGDDGVTFDPITEEMLERCWDRGVEHVEWAEAGGESEPALPTTTTTTTKSDAIPIGLLGEPVDPLQRLREALRCHTWSTAALVEHGLNDMKKDRKIEVNMNNNNGNEKENGNGSILNGNSAARKAKTNAVVMKRENPPLRIEEKLNRSTFSKVNVDALSCTSDEDDGGALEENCEEFEEMTNKIKEARAFSLREGVTDEARREHSASVAKDLLKFLDE